MENQHHKQNNPQDDWRGLGDLIALAADRITAPVRGVHQAITDRWSALAGPLQGPVRQTSRALTTPIYESIRLTGLGVGRTLQFVASSDVGPKGLRPLWESQRGSRVQAFFNGIWGDEFERQESQLSIDMTLRTATGHRIEPNCPSLGQAFPDARSRLVVLLHGLGDTEHVWNQPDRPNRTLPETLTANSFTPLVVRYNSGLSLVDNGLKLSTLLEEISASWPAVVDDISIVGHSMGGLVARAALSAAHTTGHQWGRSASHIVTLGSPHLGAPLAKGVHHTAAGLHQTSESRPIGQFLDQRSAGIKDLRLGAIDETDPPNNLVELHFIAGAVTPGPTNFLGRIIGDAIVPVASATGRGRTKEVTANHVRVMAGRNHRALVHDGEVHQQVLTWLSSNHPTPPLR